MNKSNCEGLFGRLFGHSYRPVFERQACTYYPVIEQVSRGALMELLDKYRATRYVGHVCKRCGSRFQAPHQ